jgi:hypothetical protein
VETATKTLHRLTSYAPGHRWDQPADDPRVVQDLRTAVHLRRRAEYTSARAGQPGAPAEVRMVVPRSGPRRSIR